MEDHNTEQGTTGNKMGIASMVLGIISLMAFGMLGVGVVCGILAIIFGAIQINKRPTKKGIAIAGLIMGIAGILLTLIMIVTYFSRVVITTQDILDMNNLYDYYFSQQTMEI